MKKIFVLSLIIITIFPLSGCKLGDSSDGKEYEITIQLLNSEDEIIETAYTTINGDKGSGDNGIYKYNLTDGSYTVKIKDESGNYLSTEKSLVVSGSDNLVKYNLSQDMKVVTLSPQSESGEELDNVELKVDGKEIEEENGVFQYNAKVGTSHTVTATEPKGYYEKISKDFEILPEKDRVEVEMPEVPTGDIAGDLYLESSYTDEPLKLSYGYLNYFDKKVTSKENGFTLKDIPEGKREIEVTTLFGGETTKTVDIKADETVNIDIDIPLPADFPVDNWKYGNGTSGMVSNMDKILVRWDQDIIYYYIGHTDSVKEDTPDYILESNREKMRKAVDIMDYVMKGTVNYEETSSKDNADLVIEVRDDLDDYTAGVIKEVDRTSNNRITYAKIHLNKRNMATSGVDVTAHEIGHSLGISHSAEKEHLMYSGSEVDMDTWKEEETKEKWIFGLLYSLPHPTQNPFAD